MELRLSERPVATAMKTTGSGQEGAGAFFARPKGSNHMVVETATIDWCRTKSAEAMRIVKAATQHGRAIDPQ